MLDDFGEQKKSPAPPDQAGMVVGKFVDGARVHLTSNAVQLQLTVDVVAENVLEAGPLVPGSSQTS
ncbi:hypothetical protein X767_04755 [Mesorhizobium sp. LSJC264A00]|nr:hypothetical protein X767_04755 [Mesorhizobium sp. LSJC264A00]